MSSLNNLSLESNRYLKINFDGGDLSSDAGLLLIKEFASKIGFDSLIPDSFKTNDDALIRIHTDEQNLQQMIYQILGATLQMITQTNLGVIQFLPQSWINHLLLHNQPCPDSLTAWMKIRWLNSMK